MVASTCFGITLPSSGSVPSALKIPEPVTMKLPTFLFQMEVTSCISVQYLWKYGFAKYSDNLYTPCINESDWETLAERRMIARIFALFKAYTGRRAWNAIGDRLLKPCYLSRDDYNRKIRTRKQTTDVGKYNFVNTNVKRWNQLLASLLAIYPVN
jgi:hypothetical protein